MLDVILDALIDTAKLLPFLFLTYLLMEYLEHRTSGKTGKIIRKAGYFGPAVGSLLGVVPQCGFSAAASNFYAGRVISMGTLIAIYLSTSDEMLPILISEQAPISVVAGMLATKAVIGMISGFVIDFVWRLSHKDEQEHIHDICEQEHCNCNQGGVVKSAAVHTLKIILFILLITMVLNSLLYFVGEEKLGSLVLNKPVLGPMLSGLVGLIPNCAGSVAITQLYLDKVIGFGSALAGLMTGSGVGLLVLFRVNHNKKENFTILALLYTIGVVCGILYELIF